MQAPQNYNMRKTITRLALIAMTCMLVTLNISAETVLLAEDFDAENGGVGITNYTNFGQFNVSSGAVDLIGNGFADFFPGNGLYVDLDGTGVSAGTLVSKIAFSLMAGQDYRLEFDLGNSDDQFGGTENENVLTVTLGNYQEVFTRNGLLPFQTITRVITPSASGNVNLEFDHGGADALGILLDDISLVVVPIPGVAWLFAVLSLVVLRDRRRHS